MNPSFFKEDWKEIHNKYILSLKMQKQHEHLVPVLEVIEPSRDTLDPPLSILVSIKDKLDGSLHIELLLDSKEMLLPGTTTMGKK